MMPISIVILSHNRLDEISKKLPLMISGFQNPDEFQIIVVDNSSTDGSKQFLIDLQKKHPKIKLILNDKNLGVARGRNSGFAVAQREYVVALDDDTSMMIEDLRKIPGLFEKYDKAGILAFRVFHPVSGECQNDHGAVPCEVANHHGAGFAFRKCLFDQIGGIDDACDYGAEELDFAIRVHSVGWQVLYTPELSVFHNNLERNKETEKSRRIRREYNNVRIYYKYFPKLMATRNSFRYTLLVVRYWLMTFGSSGLDQLLSAGVKGRVAGLLNHEDISSSTIEFYNNSFLEPEFGNIPIMRKVLSRLFH